MPDNLYIYTDYLAFTNFPSAARNFYANNFIARAHHALLLRQS
jgi:hypothetical protein